MAEKEAFQMFCKFCTKVFEAETSGEALAKVLEHEEECPKKRVRHGISNMQERTSKDKRQRNLQFRNKFLSM